MRYKIATDSGNTGEESQIVESDGSPGKTLREGALDSDSEHASFLFGVLDEQSFHQPEDVTVVKSNNAFYYDLPSRRHLVRVEVDGLQSGKFRKCKLKRHKLYREYDELLVITTRRLNHPARQAFANCDDVWYISI